MTACLTVVMPFQMVRRMFITDATENSTITERAGATGVPVRIHAHVYPCYLSEPFIRDREDSGDPWETIVIRASV